MLWASVQGPVPGPTVPVVAPSKPTMTPVRIELPTLGVGAPVVPVAVDGNGALGVPEDPRVVGWWAGAGDTVVLDGHVDTAAQGPGVLFRLVDLASGDAVTLRGADGSVRQFTVTDVRAYPKALLPPDVFDPESRRGQPRRSLLSGAFRILRGLARSADLGGSLCHCRPTPQRPRLRQVLQQGIDVVAEPYSPLSVETTSAGLARYRERPPW